MKKSSKTISFLLLIIIISTLFTSFNTVQATEECPMCGGDGVYEIEDGNDNDDDICPACGGTGQKVKVPDADACPMCGGDGIYEIEDGNDNDDDICPNCGGTGRKIKVNTQGISTSYFKPSKLTKDDYETAFSMASTIVNTITVVGVVISVIMVIILGIKYMFGSLEQKADYKRTMIPMLIGAILIFTSSTLVSIIYGLVSKL